MLVESLIQVQCCVVQLEGHAAVVGCGDRSGSDRNVCRKGEINISDSCFYINTCPASAQMALTSMNSSSPLSMLGFLPPPALSPEGKSTIPGVRKTPSVLVHKSPSPRLNPSSAALCLCKASRPDETMKPCAAQQQDFTAVAQHTHNMLSSPMFPPIHL